MNTSASARMDEMTVDPRNVVDFAASIGRSQLSEPVGNRQPSESQTKAYSEIEIVESKDRLKTYIAPGAVIKGSLEVEEGARIAGVVTGDLICANGTAVIEPSGEVKGSVHATERVIVMGGRVGTPAADPKERPNTELVCPGDVIVIGPGVANVVAYFGTLNAYDGGYIDGGAHPYSKRG